MKIDAWHFIRSDRRLGYDSSGLIVEPGFVYSIERDRTPKICIYGMHGSRHPFDALKYAAGPVVCRVRIWGAVEHGGNKLVGRNREVLWMADASKELRLFACWCVRRVWRLLTDERSRRAVEVAETFAHGRTAIMELRAAEAAAWDVASAAAATAAKAAVYSAACAAARAAASADEWATVYSAARAAAEAAASTTIWAAAEAAAWAAELSIVEAQRAEFQRRMLALEPRKSGEEPTA